MASKLAMADPSKDILKEWVKGCSRNDRKSQELVYRHYFRVMYAICYRYAGEEELALDLVNRGMLKVFANIHQFRDEGSLEGWMRRVVFSCVSDYFRRKKKAVIIDLEGYDRPVANHTEDKLNLDDLMCYVARLPEMPRRVFELFAIEGYQHGEIAEMLNIPEGTSKWHLSKARGQLQSWLRGSQNVKENAG